MSNFLINALVSIIPAVVLAFLWGRNSLLLMLPALVYLVVFVCAQLLPADFAPFPKGSPGSETCFRVLTISVIVLFALHLWLLWNKNFTMPQIAVAEVLQIPAWIYLWFVVGVTLQGGK